MGNLFEKIIEENRAPHKIALIIGSASGPMVAKQAIQEELKSKRELLEGVWGRLEEAGRQEELNWLHCLDDGSITPLVTMLEVTRKEVQILTKCLKAVNALIARTWRSCFFKSSNNTWVIYKKKTEERLISEPEKNDFNMERCYTLLHLVEQVAVNRVNPYRSIYWLRHSAL